MDDANSHTLLRWQQEFLIVGVGCDLVALIVLQKFRVSQMHGLLEVFAFDGNRDLLGLRDCVNERTTNDFVPVHW